MKTMFTILTLLSLGLTHLTAFASPGGDAYEKIYDRTILGKSPAQYFQVINSGWYGNFTPLRRHLKSGKSYMVIHALEPKATYDLRSAEKFRQSVTSPGLLNLDNDTMEVGHVFLSWQCQVNNREVQGTVGFTGELDTQFKKMTETGYGLSAFLATFEDGHLQTSELLSSYFDDGKSIHTLAIEVEDSVCKNGMNFVRKFVMHPDRPFEIFGLTPSPEKFEGGGCGSFGVSVLEQSGIFGKLPITKNFWRSIRGNPNLFGHGLPLPEDAVLPNEIAKRKGSKSIGLLRLFMSNWDGNGPTMRIMDPEMVLLFLRTVYRSSLDGLYRYSANEARTLMNSNLYPYRVYSGNENYGEKIVINSKFDRQANNVVRFTKTWFHGLQSKGYSVRSARIGGAENPYFTLILDR